MPNMTDPKIFENITKAMKYKAVYEARSWQVTWKSPSGSTLKTETVGNLMSGNPPVVPDENGLMFIGWDKEYTRITSDTIFTAQMGAKKYIVKWLNWNNTVIKTENIAYGGVATPPANPTRDGYIFTGWNQPFSNITSDLNITAQFTQTFSVTFKNWDGSILKTETVASGASATAPASPTRSGYIFNKWDKDFTRITANIIITALFDVAAIKVFYYDYDGRKIYIDESGLDKPALELVDNPQEYNVTYKRESINLNEFVLHVEVGSTETTFTATSSDTTVFTIINGKLKLIPRSSGADYLSAVLTVTASGMSKQITIGSRLVSYFIEFDTSLSYGSTWTGLMSLRASYYYNGGMMFIAPGAPENMNKYSPTVTCSRSGVVGPCSIVVETVNAGSYSYNRSVWKVQMYGLKDGDTVTVGGTFNGKPISPLSQVV